MKRTDEMKLGESLRFPSREALRHLHSGGRVRYCDGKETLLPPNPQGPNILDLIDQGYLIPPPTTEYPSDRRKDPVQRFSMAAQLQLMKALAILGWAAFFLELLRV